MCINKQIVLDWKEFTSDLGLIMIREDIMLFRKIINCPNIRYCLEKQEKTHPCYDIVMKQKANNLTQFQIPEPWSGDIENAPILFLCPSPVYVEKEEYPDYSWPDYIICDFFNNRFGGGLKLWVKNQLRPLLKDGTHSGEWVRYWAEVRKRTSELLGKKEIKAGADFSIFPLVHCKTGGAVEDEQTFEECIKRYFLEVFDISQAKVIVCLGKNTGRKVRTILGIPLDSNPYGPFPVGKRDRYIVCLQHPHARRVPHSLKKLVTEEELQALRVFLKKE